jgi:hypothetical protein
MVVGKLWVLASGGAAMTDDVLVYTPADPAEVRPFGNAALDSAVRKALDSRDPGDTWAFVGIADNESARVAIAIKPGEHWSFGGYLEKPWRGPLSYGVEVIISG